MRSDSRKQARQPERQRETRHYQLARTQFKCAFEGDQGPPTTSVFSKPYVDVLARTLFLPPYSAMRFRFADCVLDTDTHVLTRDGQAQDIEPQVFDLLVLLIEHAGRLVTKDQMVDAIWGGRAVSESAISARVAAVRKAVGDDGKAQAIIRTVARRGLQFVARLDPDEKEPGPAMKPSGMPNIRYARTADGAMLAYTVHSGGHGVPVVYATQFPTHPERSWDWPVERNRVEEYRRDRTVVRMDWRGCGLSDLELAANSTLDSTGDDLVAVADAAGLNQFALVGYSSGARTAVNVAARYPDRVTGLVLVAGYCDGRAVRPGVDGGGVEPILSMVREGWNQKSPAFIFSFISLYFPDASHEWTWQMALDFQTISTSENAALIRQLHNDGSIADLLPQVRAPTLVVHSRDAAVHPLSEARKLAGGIAGAELVVLNTANDEPLPGEPEWPVMVRAVTDFLKRHDPAP